MSVSALLRQVVPPVAMLVIERFIDIVMHLNCVTPVCVRRNVLIKNSVENGKRCFVVGNGASIRGMKLNKMKGEIVIVVNNFFLHPDVHEISPTHYVMIEPVAELLSHHPDEFYHPQNYLLKISDTFKGRGVSFFFNYDLKKTIEDSKLFRTENVYYVKVSRSWPDRQDVIFSDDISRSVSCGWGVIFASIMIAAHIGFKDIYFIGCDVDSFLNKKVLRFYQDVCKNESDEYQSNEYYAYGNYLSLKRWRLIVQHFKKKGINIFNAGVAGENDTCQRVDFEALFEK